MPFLVFGLISILHIKLYLRTKEFYFKNNKETMYVELEEKDNELSTKNTEIEKLKAEIENLSNKNKEKDRELKRLKADIEENEVNKDTH